MENVAVPEVAAFDEFSDHTLVREKLNGDQDHQTQSVRDHSNDSFAREHKRSFAKSSMNFRKSGRNQSIQSMNKRIEQLTQKRVKFNVKKTANV